MYRTINTNAIFYINNHEKYPIYSYIKINDHGKIIEIKEKIKISNNANTGIYCFNNIDILYEYSKRVITNNIKFKDEFYTSCIIHEMMKDNHDFFGIELNNQHVFNLGTPLQLNKYIENTFSFLFDLDGTLILTENLYYDIWKEILLYYEIELNNEMFNNYISGNNDTYVKDTILVDKNITIEELSTKKDDLFIENIDRVTLIEGAFDFLTKIKLNGHKLAIVTNCNKRVSEYILKYFKIYDFFDTIVIGNECPRPKPYPDPYIVAIQKLNTTNNKSFIFEDSKSGLLSANGVMPKCIIGLETIFSNEELLNNYANISIKNYIGFEIDCIINNTNINTNINLLKNNIKKSLIQFDIESIEINPTKLKGGFISDVIEVNIIQKDGEIISCVLKMESKNDSFLSEMSNNLDLYNKEYYFYEVISSYIPIKYPKTYGLIKDDNFNNIGVLLENLNTKDYLLNLNLNEENIETTLTIIDNIALLHSTFWNKNIDKHFKELKKNFDSKFDWCKFINSKWDMFKVKWYPTLTEEQKNIAEYIFNNYSNIRFQLSDKNLTFCHGDIKSPNIFYKISENKKYEPYFIDWQYISYGKGVQDLVFL